jgi:leader peptidase (prepilin peptidase)/N-methyltransferase
MPWLEHGLYLVLIAVLTAATITDLKYRLIYDRFVLIGLAAAVLVRTIWRPEPWWNYVLTGGIVFLVLFLIAVWTDERSIGGGDVKLFGVLGLAVGFEPFVLIFFASHLIAALFLLAVKLVRPSAVSRKSEFPFAPFILLGTVWSYIMIHII